MLSLFSFEVIRITFKNLTTKDLLQCQLVNREWYTVSVEPLYSIITINTSEKSRCYTRTLSSSSRLANYLKKIDIQELFFNNSLTRICITHIFEDLKGLESYQILLDCISEFKNLQYLTLEYPSKKQLTYFDALIEDCSQLQEVHIKLSYPKNSRSVIENNDLIHLNPADVQPRPHIHTFCCNWESINNQEQLEYVIHNFPNFKCLDINCLKKSVVDFLRYVKTIPDFSIEFTLIRRDNIIADAWFELIDICEDVVIENHYDNIEAIIIRADKTKASIRLPLPLRLRYKFCQ
ncbi:hypothetical protein BD770DRAFT_411644 [Pilaira anomala]|nr:hypothetical protein BD770DRAFT_411644 [Pilaira anomala]